MEGRSNMGNRIQIIPVAGLAATLGLTAYMVTQLHAQQPAPVTAGDFTNAAVAEVYDGQGQVVLRGQFALTDEDDDDIERKAVLRPAGAAADVTGEAEVEFAKTTPMLQEIEFSVRNLGTGTVVRFVIDNQVLGEATVDRRGRAKLDIDLPVR
jgi:hypothetical protein